jgi:hypothetical protein
VRVSEMSEGVWLQFSSVAVVWLRLRDLGVGEVLVTSEVEINPPGAGLRVGRTRQFTASESLQRHPHPQ